VVVVEGVLDALQHAPVLPQEHASNVLKSLCSLLEMADEAFNLPVDLAVKVRELIHTLWVLESHTWPREACKCIVDMQ
jgi:hypothetical protein